MSKQINERSKRRSTVPLFAALVLLAATLLARPVGAVTYISVEPIPSEDVVGPTDLAKILSIGYPKLELWSRQLVNECHFVQKVIKVLSANGAISTVNFRNTGFRVAAGGFEGVTNPTYVFTIEDSGPNNVSAADVGVISNALGSLLSDRF